MKKVVILSHCVLNSLCEMPEASSVFRKKLVNQLMDKGIHMIQLPCPELCFQSLERSSILPGDAKAEAYADYCRTLLDPVLRNLKEYDRYEIRIAGIVGIDTSPSCSVVNCDAIMMKILLGELEKAGISYGTLLDMPITEDEGHFFDNLNKF